MKIIFHQPSEEATKAFNLEFQKCAVRDFLKEKNQTDKSPKTDDKSA